jgi:hypothetical protein
MKDEDEEECDTCYGDDPTCPVPYEPTPAYYPPVPSMEQIVADRLAQAGVTKALQQYKVDLRDDLEARYLGFWARMRRRIMRMFGWKPKPPVEG